MNYRHDSFFKQTDAGFVLHGDVTSDHFFGTEPKQGNEWLGGATGQKSLPIKKQAVEDVTIIPSIQGASLTDNSVHTNDRLVAANVQGNIAPFDGTSDMNWETNDLEGQSSEHNPSGSSPLSHGNKNPIFGGVEDLRCSLVKASNDSMSLTMGNSFPMGWYENHNYNDHSSLEVPASINMYDSNLSDDFSLPGENFMRLMVASFNQEYDDDLIRQTTDDKANGNVIPSGLPDRSTNFILHYENADSSAYTPVVDPSYEPVTFTLMGHSFHQENGSFLPLASSYPEESNAPIPTVETSDEQIANLPDNAVNNNISFGEFQEAPAMSASGGHIISFEPLKGNQNPVQAAAIPALNDAVGSVAYPTITTVSPINPYETMNLTKKKLGKPRDLATIGFPTNVKSLLSTGIFDGVPVKYVSWSREKRLRGIVSGTGYICGCKECNNVRKINAYEFEQHAGCKTKHPNNHIYFDNGKTVYAVVLELRKTPPSMLFEKIQTATGSAINEENFQAWKAREFEKIYREIEASRTWRGVPTAASSG
ncbi:uncharacterized protein LOC116187504 [Punica granatum]|uniref:Uncharacterized protein LOC116187504 n=1 Tax=Punica granatum TaxID=22663 RepID=A0A6P8BN84_PUNGR|nr:uncharacterized protein LOC116187504 [Punica granatum]